MAPDLHFIDVGVEDPVHKADTWGLVWILIRELNMNLPDPSRKRSYRQKYDEYTCLFVHINLLSEGPWNRR